MIDNMGRFRGRTTLTIIFMIIFALLVIMYHLLSSEVEKNSTVKNSSHLKVEDAYQLSDATESPQEIARKRMFEAQLIGKRKSLENHRNSHDSKFSGSERSEGFKGHKIVHLDLKGAPPLYSYYPELFSLLSKLGATGVLMEYEDMFPFSGNIENISATNHYTAKEIESIQQTAKENNLIIVPLIQTFGHLEFVLKLDAYKDYREVFRYPQVICPSYNKTLPLIFEIIDQVVAAHPHAKHLHIGADEVYHLGECTRCSNVMLKNHWGKRQLFLSHVTKVANYIKKKYPHLTILMWDDEFRDIMPSEILRNGLNRLIEPVVWKYTRDPGSVLTEDLWETYASVWDSVWIGTAFKGATEPDRYYTDVSYHVENHQRWLEIIQKYSHKINFRGAFLTGWQRYDHFSVLCELFATAIPSLAINLAVLQGATPENFPNELPSKVSQILKCDVPISLTVPEPQYGWARCNFHGVKVYSATLKLYTLQQEIAKMEQGDNFRGWFKPYNVKHSFSSPSHVEYAVFELDRYKMDIIYLEREIREAMEDIYDSYTINEWLETFVAPLNERVTKLWDAKERILDKYEWPRRPIVRGEL